MYHSNGKAKGFHHISGQLGGEARIVSSEIIENAPEGVYRAKVQIWNSNANNGAGGWKNKGPMSKCFLIYGLKKRL